MYQVRFFSFFLSLGEFLYFIEDYIRGCWGNVGLKYNSSIAPVRSINWLIDKWKSDEGWKFVESRLLACIGNLFQISCHVLQAEELYIHKYRKYKPVVTSLTF